MKNVKYYFIAILAVALNFQLAAQSIISLSEVDESGKVFDANPKKKEEKITQYPIVDINSSIKIKLDKDKISEMAFQMSGKTIDLPSSQMKIISEVLKIRKKLIEDATLSDTVDFETRHKALVNFSKHLIPVFQYITSLPSDNLLRTRVNDAIVKGKTPEEKYSAIFNLLEEEIDKVRSDYGKAIEDNKIYFRLGAFLNNNKNPVHLEGFDTFKEGEPFKVPRFATSISQEEKENFNKYKNIATDFNNDADKALKKMLKDALDPILMNLKIAIENKIALPLLQFKNGIDTITVLEEDLKDKEQKIQSNVVKLQDAVKAFIETVQNTNDTNYFDNLERGINDLSQNIILFQSNLKVIAADLQNKDLKSAQAAYQSFSEGLKSGNLIIDSLINNVKSFFDTQVRLNIGITQNIKQSLFKLGEEVKKIPLENIPDETTLNLITSGQRKEGDKIYLKAVIGAEPPGKEPTQEKTVDFVQIKLYQVGLHSIIRAVMIFADNTSSEFAAGKQFQFDPSYSVIFKYGTRKYPKYNDFFELGAGVNMATLDFNNDNAPEIGIGLVVSTFNDYLQCGYGRNFGIDQNYWFFGIRLPFIGLNLGGNTKILEGEN